MPNWYYVCILKAVGTALVVEIVFAESLTMTTTNTSVALMLDYLSFTVFIGLQTASNVIVDTSPKIYYMHEMLHS